MGMVNKLAGAVAWSLAGSWCSAWEQLWIVRCCLGQCLQGLMFPGWLGLGQCLQGLMFPDWPSLSMAKTCSSRYYVSHWLRNRKKSVLQKLPRRLGL